MYTNVCKVKEPLNFDNVDDDDKVLENQIESWISFEEGGLNRTNSLVEIELTGIIDGRLLPSILLTREKRVY